MFATITFLALATINFACGNVIVGSVLLVAAGVALACTKAK